MLILISYSIDFYIHVNGETSYFKALETES
jgi:hypothetical protein